MISELDFRRHVRGLKYLSPLQLRILDDLVMCDGVMTWEPDSYGVSKQAASRALQRLEERGLVNRSRPDGWKTSEVRLTDDGIRAMA